MVLLTVITVLDAKYDKYPSTRVKIKKFKPGGGIDLLLS